MAIAFDGDIHFRRFFSLIESPQSQLSIGEEIIENGHHHQKVLSFQVGDSGGVKSSWVVSLSKNLPILILEYEYEYEPQISQYRGIFIAISPESPT